MKNPLPRQLQQALQYHQKGKLGKAEALYRQILKFQPNHVQALQLMGLLYQQTGRGELARETLGRATELAPDNAGLWRNLALVSREQGDLPAAVAAYRRTLKLTPADAETWYNLGFTLEKLADWQAAYQAFEQAVALKPDLTAGHYNLGVLAGKRKQLQTAEAHYRRTLALEFNHGGALYNLAVVLRLMDRIDEARPIYARLLAQQSPANIYLQLERDTLFPVILDDAATAAEIRQHLIQTLQQYPPNGINLADQAADFSAANPLTLLFLNYHNQDDRPLKEMFAARFRVDPAPTPPPPQATGRYRIAFLVSRSHEGIFSRAMGGLLDHFDRARFDVTIICAADRVDAVRRRLTRPDHQFLPLPANNFAAIETIRRAGFELIFFWEIGSDSTNYFLPFFRLAPIQATGWGSMATTGLSQVDYFVSSDYFEPPDAQQRYTETLVPLPAMPAWFKRPAQPATPKTRADFGLNDSDHLYCCPQAALKFHPDFDEILAGILAQDPAGRLLVFGDSQHRIQNVRARWQQRFPAMDAQVQVLPHLPYTDYLAVLALSDVLLDTIYFNGGVTTYEGLSTGTPLVTMPGPLMIGRMTAGAYRRIGLTDCVVDSPAAYVDLAVKLGTDSAYNAQLRQKILAANPVLYEDDEAVRALETFLSQAIERIR